jgi:Secretion system C-terminal sorting domain
MKILKLAISLLLLCFGLTTVQAQIIAAVGGNTSKKSNTLGYPIEKTGYATPTEATGSATLSVQRAFDISTVTGTKAAQGIHLQTIIYPNQATDFVVLKTDNWLNEDMKYILYDVNGRVLVSNRVDEEETNVPMSNLAAAAYFLTISNKQVSKTFKIVKN